MPLHIVRADITRIKADAVVNATNSYFIPGGNGVDRKLNLAAGPELQELLRQTAPCGTGGTVVTPSFKLENCRWIIHAVPPVYCDGKRGEREALEACYGNILKEVERYGLRSVAVPLLAAGANGYPLAEAYSVATSCFREYFALNDSELEVKLILYSERAVELGKRLDGDIADNMPAPCAAIKAETAKAVRPKPIRPEGSAVKASRRKAVLSNQMKSLRSDMLLPPAEELDDIAFGKPSAAYYDLDKSFADMCDWWREQKDIPVNVFYSHANITKAAFSNIRCKPNTVPKITTALACAVGLRLDREQTDDLLRRAGLALTPYHAIDRLVLKHMEAGDYNIDAINADLYDHDLALLGSKMT